MQGTGARTKRVLLLMSPNTYRAGAFLEAAAGLGLEVVQGVDLPAQLAGYWNVPLHVDFSNPEDAIRKIVEFHTHTPLDAVLSVDDSATVLAAKANEALGLPGNSPESALAARDKHVMREMLAAGGAPVPGFRRFSVADDAGWIASQVDYPCVVKPLRLSGSRGVIRADGPQEFARAFARIRRLLVADGNDPTGTQVLVEDFIPGLEVAVEGLLTAGSLRVLALFDKPDPLDGPFFEETLYVTPSRLPEEMQAHIASCTARAAAALGLGEGPVHAELRVNDAGPWIVEIAGRSIGGLCSRILQFGAGVCLEELILRHAVGLNLTGLEREERAAGVMMIPIPSAGLLTGVDGVEEARAVEGVEDVQVTARLRQPLVPLPEGASYLGFIFARGEDPAAVEEALRESHSRLKFRIQRQIPLLNAFDLTVETAPFEIC